LGTPSSDTVVVGTGEEIAWLESHGVRRQYVFSRGFDQIAGAFGHGETLIDAVFGRQCGMKRGCVAAVLAQQRLVLFGQRPGMFGKVEVLEYRVADVQLAAVKVNRFGGELQIAAAAGKTAIRGLRPEVAQRFAASLRREMANARSDAKAAPVPWWVEAELQHLTDLHHQGVLTDQNFEDQKRRLLS